jgi:anti-sigma regulatory factor (Ser/Thr protein kinase)
MLQMNDNAHEGYKSPHRARLSLTVEPASVAEGRQFVREVLDGWNLVALREAVVLVASELITNTLLHTDSPPTVQLMKVPGGLRLEIEDESGTHPRKRSYAADATTGRGMLLVESMSSRWGTEPVPGGKVVWCEFEC